MRISDFRSSRLDALSPELTDVTRSTDRTAPGLLDASYEVDGLAPRYVVEPETTERLGEELRAADEEGAAVVPWGGGAHMTLGSVPLRYDLALCTSKLDRVVEHEPADMTITVEAGMAMGRLQSLLGEHGQLLPIDAPAHATIGGVVAAGTSGPSRHAYGLPRDWLIGCKLALADGTIVKGGGRVVKNVAGYDLPKLVVGSLGTLGVIVEATFKLAPLPTAQATLLATFKSLEVASAAIIAADQRGLALRAVALLTTGWSDTAMAAFWMAGPERAVARSKRELDHINGKGTGKQLERAESERWWTELSQSYRITEGRACLRLSVPPSKVGAVLEALATEAGVASVAYPTTGLIEIDSPSDVGLIGRLQRAAVAARGTAIIASAAADVKARIDAWGEAGEAISVMKRLKEEFDPRGTLNPGRFVGGI